MTKTSKNTRIRIAGSIILLLSSTAFITYWGMGLPFPGDVVNIDKEYLWVLAPFLVIPLVWLIVAIALLPGGVNKFFKGIRLKIGLLVLIIATAVTLLTAFVPFPADTPGCCMIGPSRDRGLPIGFAHSQQEFGLGSTDPYPEPEYNFGWLATDIVIWSFVVLYIHRVRTITGGKHV